MAQVYVLDDDPVVLAAIRTRFETEGHEVVVTNLWSELAPALIAKPTPGTAALICDLHMPGIYGPDFVRIVRRYNDRLPIVLLSGDGQATLIEAATECGACAAVHKGELDTLVPVVERLLASVQDLPMTG